MRALVADDHAIFRHGLVATLLEAPGIELVGEACGGEQAVALAAELRPDVVVLVLNLPGADGVAAAARIVAARPGTGVLVLTTFEDDESIFAALRAGALGYLLKGSRPAQVVRAVRAVGDGEAVLGPTIAARVLGRLGAPPDRSGALPDLTGRERQVLALMVAGRGDHAIARALGLSPKTVRNHVTAILRKLRVASRAQAVERAVGAGAVPPGDHYAR
ncbi:response regulator transcription factor [Actinosynnema sp. NPDC020468]|uniref:response regulator transcription factor n=1 Tax=Actinosynnema sp. NPDC020468 TaxID=3154488 RepID=UPI0033CC2263